jgi:hypothetical protein
VQRRQIKMIAVVGHPRPVAYSFAVALTASLLASDVASGRRQPAIEVGAFNAATGKHWLNGGWRVIDRFARRFGGSAVVARGDVPCGRRRARPATGGGGRTAPTGGREHGPKPIVIDSTSRQP